MPCDFAWEVRYPPSLNQEQAQQFTPRRKDARVVWLVLLYEDPAIVWLVSRKLQALLCYSSPDLAV